jgi:GT2 family glycosyltransferase
MIAHDRVTLVVPARGRPELTRALLRSLVDAGGSCPIVLVDDGSTPSLEPIVREFGELRIDYVRVETSRGPAAARNLGIARASTPLVAFTDNDTQVTPGWLGALVRHLEDAPPDVAGVGGRVIDDGRNAVGEYATRLTLLDPLIHGGRVLYLVTANCAFRRSALARVGGFDERFSVPGGEDPELCFRLLKAGYRLEHVPAAVVHHSYSGSWLEFARMFRRYGAGCRRAMNVLSAR